MRRDKVLAANDSWGQLARLGTNLRALDRSLGAFAVVKIAESIDQLSVQFVSIFLIASIACVPFSVGLTTSCQSLPNATTLVTLKRAPKTSLSRRAVLKRDQTLNVSFSCRRPATVEIYIQKRQQVETLHNALARRTPHR